MSSVHALESALVDVEMPIRVPFHQQHSVITHLQARVLALELEVALIRAQCDKETARLQAEKRSMSDSMASLISETNTYRRAYGKQD